MSRGAQGQQENLLVVNESVRVKARLQVYVKPVHPVTGSCLATRSISEPGTVFRSPRRYCHTPLRGPMLFSLRTPFKASLICALISIKTK